MARVCGHPPASPGVHCRDEIHVLQRRAALSDLVYVARRVHVKVGILSYQMSKAKLTPDAPRARPSHRE